MRNRPRPARERDRPALAVAVHARGLRPLSDRIEVGDARNVSRGDARPERLEPCVEGDALLQAEVLVEPEVGCGDADVLVDLLLVDRIAVQHVCDGAARWDQRAGDGL